MRRYPSCESMLNKFFSGSDEYISREKVKEYGFDWNDVYDEVVNIIIKEGKDVVVTTGRIPAEGLGPDHPFMKAYEKVDKEKVDKEEKIWYHINCPYPIGFVRASELDKVLKEVKENSYSISVCRKNKIKTIASRIERSLLYQYNRFAFWRLKRKMSQTS